MVIVKIRLAVPLREFLVKLFISLIMQLLCERRVFLDRNVFELCELMQNISMCRTVFVKAFYHCITLVGIKFSAET